MTAADAALARVVAALPAAEDRPGQREMAAAVDVAIAGGHHVVVQAGTGTGKTLGYLVPAIVARKRVVVATATKALQDQLAAKDLPFLERHLGVDFTWSVLKGRSNYLCMQRVRELSAADTGQLELEEMSGNTKLEIMRLAEWAGTTRTGDATDAPAGISDRAWQAVSVGSDECPGAKRCPMGDVCFAESARQRCEHADVVVVNLHLYGLDVASGGAILPEHDVLVVDEAHQLEDIASDTVGLQIAPSRFVTVSAALRKVIAEPDVVGAVAEAASGLREVLAPSLGDRLGVPLPDALVDVLNDARRRLDAGMTALRAIDAAGKSARVGRGAAAGAARRAAHRPADRDDRRRRRRHRRLGAVRQRDARPAAPGDRSARRRPDPARRRLEQAHRGARQRHHPAGADRLGRDCPATWCSSTSAARSTTPTTRCCTAPDTCPTRARRPTARRRTTSSPR